MKRVLITPLNWGLGHATRCIPLIRRLEQMGVEPVLASDGDALRLLRTEFPHLPSFDLPSYRIRYRSHNMVLNIGRQLPRILYAIQKEHAVTERLVRTQGIQGIISDNRYGCFSRKINSVILTHQLHVQIPAPGLEWMVNRVLRLALRQFDAVWAPDEEGQPNLSGRLSHGEPVHPHTHYIGILTRMSHYESEPEYDVAVVLSGPEPQRTYLEQRLMEQAISMPQKFIFIQGKTRTREHYYAADNIEVVSFLTARELNDVLLAGDTIVCRSGYSSLMDLAVLGKKAILIPTPGQTEQEYLAERLEQKGFFLRQTQQSIDLEKGLKAVQQFTGIPLGSFETCLFENVLKRWLDMIDN